MIPETTFEIDGNKYSLRFSTKTIINIEGALGKPIGSLLNIDDNNVSIELLSIFFTEALRDLNGNKVQPKDIDVLLDSVSVEEFIEIVQNGFNQVFPEKQEGVDKGNRKKTQN